MKKVDHAEEAVVVVDLIEIEEVVVVLIEIEAVVDLMVDLVAGLVAEGEEEVVVVVSKEIMTEIIQVEMQHSYQEV